MTITIKTAILEELLMQYFHDLAVGSNIPALYHYRARQRATQELMERLYSNNETEKKAAPTSKIKHLYVTSVPSANPHVMPIIDKTALMEDGSIWTFSPTFGWSMLPLIPGAPL